VGLGPPARLPSGVADGDGSRAPASRPGPGGDTPSESVPGIHARRPSRPLVLPAALIAAGALCAAGVETAFILAPPPAPWVALLFPGVALVYVAIGLAAWLRRPSSALGPLIIAGGGCLYLIGLGNMGSPWLGAVAAVTATLILAVIVHLLLGFPTGRLRDAASRRVVAAGYAVSLVLQAPLYLFAPEGKLSVADRHDLAQIGLQVQRGVGACVVLATCWLLARRIRHATPERRRVLLPLAAYGMVALLTIPVISAMAELWGGATLTQAAVQVIVIGFVPAAFVVAASRGGFARTTDLAELSAWLGADEAGRPALGEALAATLGDPSLKLLFRLPDGDALVDARGVEVARPVRDDARRGVADVTLAGEPVGAIVYDAILLDRAEEVREASRVAALAVDRERLTASLRASRARILAAADDERRRIARDLHDGLQSRLVFLAIQAGTGAEPAALRMGIEAAIDELRELVDGVMPAPLTERGLAAAVTDLADRLPSPIALRVEGLESRLTPAVEAAAYFVVSEAIVNAVKHAGPDGLAVALERIDGHVRIEVADAGAGGVRLDGGGMRGMADRVSAFDGDLTVGPAAGGGTRVVAVIPCAS
jgi:signal transduction histidine kinase